MKIPFWFRIVVFTVIALAFLAVIFWGVGSILEIWSEGRQAA